MKRSLLFLVPVFLPCMGKSEYAPERVQVSKPDPETQFVLNQAASVASSFAHILADPNNPQNVGLNVVNMAGSFFNIFLTVAKLHLSEEATITDCEEWLTTLSDDEKEVIGWEIIRAIKKEIPLEN